MSTTSTTYEYNCKRNIKNCNSTTNEKYTKSFRTREEIDKNIPSKKRSNDRVIDELSSFIAEFSYLTDGQDSSLETPKKPNQPYNTHPEQSSENNEEVFNDNPRPYRNNYNRCRKSVEWIDQSGPGHTINDKFYTETPVETSKVRRRRYISRQARDLDYIRLYPDHTANEQFYIDDTPVETSKDRRRRYISRQARDLDYVRAYPDHTRNERFYIETPVETSNVRRRRYISRQARDLDYVIERLKNRSPNQRIKIKRSDDGNSHSRSPRPTLKHCKSCHDGERLMRFRIESDERNRKLPHQSARRKRSNSVVRDWPLRYKKKKTYRIRKHTLVRKENCIPLERKEEISSASPTVITLYPKNTKDKHSQDKSDELDFLVDPNLPCKCQKCMRKYELLKKIDNDEPKTLYYKPKNEFQAVAIEDDIVSHPRTIHKQPEKCACKKTQRSSHTVLHPKTSNQMENNVFYPQELKCTAAHENHCCCNTQIQKSHTKFFNGFCKCPKNLVHYSIPPTYQPCLPNQMVADYCRPCQFYTPHSNLRYHKLKPSPYPCDDEHLMSNWNLNEIGSCDEQNGGTSYKSIYFRFDCVGHQIDPSVTQYFQSILNNKIY